MSKSSTTPSSPPRVTLESVAKATGLGRTTVSDILNRGASANYSLKTRERVAQAVRELGYAPSRAAQTMARGRSGMIGFMLTRTFSNPFWARLADATENELRRRGLRMQLAVADGNPETERQQIANLIGDQVEGLIVAPVYEQKDIEQHKPLFEGRVPLVVLGGPFDFCDGVDQDDSIGGTMLVDHLLEMGHRRIGYLCSPDADLEQAKGSRFAALRDRLRREGLYEPGWIVRQTDTGRFQDSYQSALAFGKRWLQTPAHERPTAMMCHNDQTAMTAIAALAPLGIRLPDDLSLTGYDNLPESAYLVPGLTTVDCNVSQQMSSAIDLLCDRIAHPDKPRVSRPIEPRLVVRRSVRRLG